MTCSTGRWLGGLLLILALLSSGAHGQGEAVRTADPPVATTFVDLAPAVNVGRRLVLTTTDGATVRGCLEGLDGSRLLIRTGDGIRTFSERDVREVRRRGDRLWNGALIGLGAGALGGMLFGASRPGCAGESICGGIGFLAGAPLGSLIGLTVDALMPHDDLLYARPGTQSRRWFVEPLIGVRGYGARSTIAF